MFELSRVQVIGSQLFCTLSLVYFQRVFSLDYDIFNKLTAVCSDRCKILFIRHKFAVPSSLVKVYIYSIFSGLSLQLKTVGLNLKQQEICLLDDAAIQQVSSCWHLYHNYHSCAK